jgi:prefoldin subunit 5
MNQNENIENLDEILNQLLEIDNKCKHQTEQIFTIKRKIAEIQKSNELLNKEKLGHQNERTKLVNLNFFTI